MPELYYPGEVRVCLEEMVFQGGETLVVCRNLWAVVDTESGAIVRYEADDRTKVKPDDIASFAAERWLLTGDGLVAVQDEIIRAIEDERS
jgi:hypothetical protein